MSGLTQLKVEKFAVVSDLQQEASFNLLVLAIDAGDVSKQFFFRSEMTYRIQAF
jgi:hypothetical protein